MIRRYIVRSLTIHRGSPRIYLDTKVLADAGFEAGASYSRHTDHENRRVVLRVDAQGQYRVSRKEANGQVLPVIDINSKAALDPLDGLAAVRLVIQDNMICMMPMASELNAQRRLARLRENLSQGKLTTASLSHGGGILDNAAHTGLKQAGIDSQLAMANEIDTDLLEHAAEHNEVWHGKTVGLGAPMQEVVQDEWLMSKIPQVDILAVGIPCSGASRAGVSKRKLGMMEEHPEVGHLVASFLMVVQRSQPSIVVVECVTEYQQSASAQIMRQHLRDCGYAVKEVVLDGKSFGVLEHRKRWFLVAATQGVAIELENLAPVCTAVRTLAEIMEPVPSDDPAWRDFNYLKVKQERDQEKGNGFAMQIVQPGDSQVPVLRKGYAKGGSTDPLLAHPEREGVYRLFTANEHARIKEIPEHLIEGMSQSKAHQLLGQSVLFTPVKALFERIGISLLNWYHQASGQTQHVSPVYQLALATG